MPLPKVTSIALIHEFLLQPQTAWQEGLVVSSLPAEEPGACTYRIATVMGTSSQNTQKTLNRVMFCVRNAYSMISQLPALTPASPP